MPDEGSAFARPSSDELFLTDPSGRARHAPWSGFECFTHTQYTDLNCAPGTESAVHKVPNGFCMPESEDMQTFAKYECDPSGGGWVTLLMYKFQDFV